LLATAFDYGIDDIERIGLNSVQAAFLPEAEKRAMVEKFNAAYRELRLKHGLPLRDA
jgi:adenosine deaminase